MVNKVILQGRLVRDIEVKQTQSGVSFTEFTVAWSEKYKEAETRCFLRCKAWRQTAEFLGKYFHQGSEIVVEGQMVTEEWEKDNQKQSRTICNVEKVNFCGSKSDNKQNTQQAAQKKSDDGFMNIPDGADEELPFN